VGGRVLREGPALLHTWPGVYFEAAFRGASIGVALSDADGIYNVEIDGTAHPPIPAPGETTHWISGLAPGRHTIRVAKRTESTARVPRFLGFVPAPDGALLPGPGPRARQIEFIGDSSTAGYGSLSETRECTPAELHERSDVDRSFAVLTARRFDLDYHISAFSGLGLVRNWNGTKPHLEFPKVYTRVLREVDDSSWVVPPDWRPRLVVVGLGGNDFSTPIQPGEAWTDASLRDAFKRAYRELLHTVRSRYGPDTTFLLGSVDLPHLAAFPKAVQEVADEETAAGHRVHHWTIAGLDWMGCHGHPSPRDHRVISEQLAAWMEAHPAVW
jgi:hypothetical protein